MKIGVISRDVIGLVAAVGFAELGHDVVCAAVGVGELDCRRRASGQLQFTRSVAAAARHAQVVFMVAGPITDRADGADRAGCAEPSAEDLAAGIELAINLGGPAIVVGEERGSFTAAARLARLMALHTAHEIVVVGSADLLQIVGRRPSVKSKVRGLEAWATGASLRTNPRERSS